ncbi:MAG: twin-arginine translocase subunit TatC, partial [Planctomycetota bacterium]
IFFFGGGAYFAYRYVVPVALEFLFPFARKLGAVMRPTLREYLRFFLMIHVAFGVVFETPLVILALARMGLVTARGLLRRWQIVIVAAFVLGALLTPPDVMTQSMMAGSIIALYALSLILAQIFGRKRTIFDAQGDDEAETGKKKPETPAPDADAADGGEDPAADGEAHDEGYDGGYESGYGDGYDGEHMDYADDNGDQDDHGEHQDEDHEPDGDGHPDGTEAGEVDKPDRNSAAEGTSVAGEEAGGDATGDDATGSEDDVALPSAPGGPPGPGDRPAEGGTDGRPS